MTEPRSERNVSIGKFGSFPANRILSRPYHVTYEILDKQPGHSHAELRIVTAAELHESVIADSSSTPSDAAESRLLDGGDGVEYEVVGENGEVVMRTNRQTIDDPTRQRLSMEEIETLKKDSTGGGKDIIAKLMSSHSALDQKTTFSLAKYTLRKTKKYLRRFTILPLDVPLLTQWITMDREPLKILECKDETMSLINSWANVHYCGDEGHSMDDNANMTGSGRWLIIDETGGLLVASIAERMGILLPPRDDDEAEDSDMYSPPERRKSLPYATGDGDTPDQVLEAILPKRRRQRPPVAAMSATHNTITLIHANAQPNLSLLKYFHYETNTPNPSHPLHAHLKTVSWLQLLAPEEDMGYAEPPEIDEETLQSFKSGKRATHYRKRRRWQRVKSVVDETRNGGFDGLIVASNMPPGSILQHTVPLLRGSAPVVVYSPTIEPLVELADLYSTSRRTAFVTAKAEGISLPQEDFPVNPTHLLAPVVQTVRLRPWQCLPGRTHPVMTGKGGAEGFLFTATRVIPADGKVEARGKFKRRKINEEQNGKPIVSLADGMDDEMEVINNDSWAGSP